MTDGGAEHPALAGFHAPVRSWFAATFAGPTRAQELGWPLIQAGASPLILAPTGSGKTLAAFLAAIDRVMFEPPPPKNHRCAASYSSPPKPLPEAASPTWRRRLPGSAGAPGRRATARTSREV